MPANAQPAGTADGTLARKRDREHRAWRIPLTARGEIGEIGPVEIPQPLWGPGVGIASKWHPQWCAPARCEYALGGAHTSRPFVIRSDAASDVRASIRVWEQRETAYEPAIVYVELILGNHTSNERIRADLSLAQARKVIDALRDALDRIDVTEFAGLSTVAAVEPDAAG